MFTKLLGYILRIVGSFIMIKYFKVKLLFELLIVRGQQHSFSTQERMSCESVEDLETQNVSRLGGLEPPSFGFIPNVLTTYIMITYVYLYIQCYMFCKARSYYMSSGISFLALSIVMGFGSCNSNIDVDHYDEVRALLGNFY